MSDMICQWFHTKKNRTQNKSSHTHSHARTPTTQSTSKFDPDIWSILSNPTFDLPAARQITFPNAHNLTHTHKDTHTHSKLNAEERARQAEMIKGDGKGGDMTKGEPQPESVVCVYIYISIHICIYKCIHVYI